ncbi:MAG: adenosylcobinamide-GDP ribazoletransferase [Pseudomonadota bacterium]
MSRLGEEWAAFLLALQFMTRLPVRGDLYTAERFARSPCYYPAVGLVVGGLAGGVFWMAASVLPPLLAALLAVGAAVLLTGGLHEDGLADTGDGLGGGRDRARALEIMRDSRIGSYGVLALGLVTAIAVAALAALPPATGAAALVAAHGVGRAGIVLFLATADYARSDGAGQGVSGALGGGALAVAFGTGVFALLPLAHVAGAGAALLGLALAAVLTLLLRARAVARLGGYTGDTLGAVQQLGVAGVLIGAAAWA